MVNIDEMKSIEINGNYDPTYSSDPGPQKLSY